MKRIIIAVLLALTIAWCALGCAQKAGPETASSVNNTAETQREKVTPAPQVNPDAVVWRTPQPPEQAAAGDVWIEPKSGMEMVYIPEGDFLLGSSDAELTAWLKENPKDQRKWFADQQPQCRLSLPGFWIGKTEVTAEQYARFVQAEKYRTPDYWEGGVIPAGFEHKPVILINWPEAQSFCKWAGGHLPLEAQWEKSARGPDGREFPWGNQWDSSLCRNFALIVGQKGFATDDEQMATLARWINEHDLVREGMSIVGLYPAGASPYGCMDMAGNVWEWCADWYEAGAYQRYAKDDFTLPAPGKLQTRVVRSECFLTGRPERFRCATRIKMGPGEVTGNLGFRCVIEAAPSKPDTSR